MTHGSLFSGIGGFDLAAEWMGWENVFHCEWNPFGQRVLKHYWPNAIQYTDINKTDFTKHNGTIDVISGGFPCQPYSSAGMRRGKDDERHLWPQMCRAIREIAPRFVVGENVRGLTNWNGGLVFDEVCTDLENLGYQVAPFLIPACATNAPHRRERIWFVAYSDCNGRDKCHNEYEEQSNKRGIDAFSNTEQRSAIWNATDTYKWEQKFAAFHSGMGRFEKFNAKDSWIDFPTQSPICRGDDGIPTQLDGITFSKWRKESIMAYGNAIVPNVAFEIFKAIQQYETTYNR
jgi:DNA (cytosine-5)-methyltransferase 1